MQPILLFFLSALALPDFDRDDALDLRANYFAQTRWFFGIVIALVFVSLLRNVIIKGHLPPETDFAFQLIFMVAAAGGAIFTNEAYHKVLAPVSTIAYVLYIALLFTALR